MEIANPLATELMIKVNADVIQERLNQNIKWGHQRHSNGDWLKILIEEVGEVAQAMQTEKGWGKESDAQDLYKELIHTSAVASAMAEQVKERIDNRNESRTSKGYTEY